MRAWRHSLVWKIALPVPLALLAMILAIGFIIPRQIEADTQATAVENALQTIAQFRSVRDYYNTAIVPKIRGSQDLKLTHLHANDPKGAPIPATFMLDMSARLQDKGVSLSFYSPYPFPERANRQTDAFQKAAWEQFQKNPDTPFIDRTVLNGKEVVRVAVGDRLGEACVACHNSHPQSPKKDWKVGDVRGVFEIQTVIDAQLARGHMLTYSVLGVVLLGGLAFGRPLLALVLDSVFDLTQEGWRKLTFRWGLFFFFLAGVNEVVWRTQTTDFWVSFKVFGIMPLTIAFALAQTPLLLRHERKTDDGKTDRA